MYSKCITFWKRIKTRNGHMPTCQMQTCKQDEISKIWVQNGEGRPTWHGEIMGPDG